MKNTISLLKEKEEERDLSISTIKEMDRQNSKNRIITEDTMHKKLEEYVSTQIMSYVIDEDIIMAQTVFNLKFEYFITKGALVDYEDVLAAHFGIKNEDEETEYDLNSEEDKKLLNLELEKLVFTKELINELMLKKIYTAAPTFGFQKYAKLVYVNVDYDEEATLKALQTKNFNSINFKVNLVLCNSLLMGQIEQFLFTLTLDFRGMFGSALSTTVDLEFTDVTDKFIAWYRNKYEPNNPINNSASNLFKNKSNLFKFPWEDYKWNRHILRMTQDIYESFLSEAGAQLAASFLGTGRSMNNNYRILIGDFLYRRFDRGTKFEQRAFGEWDANTFKFHELTLSTMGGDKVQLFAKFNKLYELTTLSFRKVTNENKKTILLNLFRVTIYRAWRVLLSEFNVLDQVVQNEVNKINTEIQNKKVELNNKNKEEKIEGGIYIRLKNRIYKFFRSSNNPIKIKKSLKQQVAEFEEENWANVFKENRTLVVINSSDKVKFIEAVLDYVYKFATVSSDQINRKLLEEIILEHGEDLIKQLLRGNMIEVLLPVKIIEKNIF